jgi:triosephosphate isomerase
MRNPLIAGNWKMNKNVGEAISLAREVRDGLAEIDSAEVVLCPPFTALGSVAEVIRNSDISLGAQNMYWEAEGAYTGEISPKFLIDLGCDWLIVGHSERRKYFGETDHNVNKKVKAALSFGLKPIVCVGETLEEREAGITEKVVESQVRGAVDGLHPQQGRMLSIAYEPVWAIGTGKTASPDVANEAHNYIRNLLQELLDKSASSVVRILYGGSVTPENARELLSMPEIDGALVGGASLRAASFVDIVRKTGSQ